MKGKCVGGAALFSLASAVFCGGVTAPTAQATTPPTIVAIGDSFTSGFGYYGTTSVSEWGLTELSNCKPGDGVLVLNDGCSSNSSSRASTPAGVSFATDYGYTNNVSWAAKFAHSVGTDSAHYYNFAVTGSTAREWANDSLLMQQSSIATSSKPALELVHDVNPDLVLSTLGGNPTLSKVLFGSGNICTLTWDKYSCFADLIRDEHTQDDLVTIYSRILRENVNSKVLVMLYPQVVPTVTFFSAEALLSADEALNDAIQRAITTVQASFPGRIAFASKYFNTGLPPGTWSEFATCHGAAALGRGTDGPSHQADSTQQVFSTTRAVTGWCAGEPWVISGDTGIHPNTAGYNQMAAAAYSTWTSWDAATHSAPVFTAFSPVTTAMAGAEISPYVFAATSTPTADFTLGSGTLPPGLLLSERGVFSGTPTTAGAYSFTVSASNGIDPAVRVSLRMQIDPVPTPAPVPVVEAEAIPTPSASPTPVVVTPTRLAVTPNPTQPSTQPTALPRPAVAIPGGITLASTESAERTTPRVMRYEATTNVQAAPMLVAQINQPVKLVTGGLAPNSVQEIKIKNKGAYASLGSVTTDANGTVMLPVFTSTRLGDHLVAVTAAKTQKTRYIRIQIKNRR